MAEKGVNSTVEVKKKHKKHKKRKHKTDESKTPKKKSSDEIPQEESAKTNNGERTAKIGFVIVVLAAVIIALGWSFEIWTDFDSGFHFSSSNKSVFDKEG